MKNKLQSIAFFLIVIASILEFTLSGVNIYLEKFRYFLMGLFVLIAAVATVVDLYRSWGEGKGQRAMRCLSWIELFLVLAVVATFAHNVFFV